MSAASEDREDASGRHEESRRLVEEAAAKVIERCHLLVTTKQPKLSELRDITYCLRESYYILMMLEGPSLEELEKMVGDEDDDDDDFGEDGDEDDGGMIGGDDEG